MGADADLDLLAAAELWEAPREPGAGGQPLFTVGWEDADPFCAAVCTNDVGLAFCRHCAEPVVRRVLATGRPARDRCGAGVGLLAFPAPLGDRRQVAVLRVGRPTPADAAAAATTVRVAPATLRRAASGVPAPDPRAVRAAARILRSPAGLRHWRARTRDLAATRRRTTTAALAQMIVTGDEYHDLYRTTRRQVRALERSQRRIDALAREAVRQLETARVVVAHRIHDGAAQSMIGAFRHLEAARTLAPAVPRLDEQLDLAAQRLATAIGETRAIMGDLLPPGLAELGLRSAIETRSRALAAERRSTDDDAPLIEVDGTLPRLAGWVEQSVYGATTEAITNAVRHGRAKRIMVHLRTRGTRAIIEIEDDGRGFDPAVAARSAGESHLGLLGIARQARWLGGTATISSRPGAGTKIRISLPLERHLASAAPVGEGAGPR